METHLGIENTRLHEDSLHTLGFGPDILHLVEDNVLKDIGFIPGDVIRLKQSVRQWWSTNAKCKWVSHTTSPLAQCYVHMCQDCIRIGKFSFLIYDGMRSLIMTACLGSFLP